MEDNNGVSMLPADRPLPTVASDLCPGPCDDGDTCFCAEGWDLVHQGVRKLQEKWPILSNADAFLLVGEMVVGNAAAFAQAEMFPRKAEEVAVGRRFADMLIKEAVGLAFDSFRDFADIDARFEAERDTRRAIEHLLCERVRDLRWRLSRERRSLPPTS